METKWPSNSTDDWPKTCTLASVQDETKIQQPVKKLLKMMAMLPLVRQCHQNVVQVAKNPVQAGYHLIHHTLKGLAAVAKTEGHHGVVAY
jgi:hypothetical protein